MFASRICNKQYHTRQETLLFAVKLSVNGEQIQAMIFCKRKGRQQYEFKLYGSNIEIVESYTYLGLILNYTLQKKETQHVKKYNLLQIFNIILNTEISITLH